MLAVGSDDLSREAHGTSAVLEKKEEGWGPSLITGAEGMGMVLPV